MIYLKKKRIDIPSSATAKHSNNWQQFSPKHTETELETILTSFTRHPTTKRPTLQIPTTHCIKFKLAKASFSHDDRHVVRDLITRVCHVLQAICHTIMRTRYHTAL